MTTNDDAYPEDNPAGQADMLNDPQPEDEKRVCPKCGKDHSAQNPKLAGLIQKVADLDEERQSLLVDRVLATLSTGLQETAMSPGVSGDLAASLSLLVNLTNLAGYINGNIARGHEDWTRTGDKAVNALLVEYLTILDSAKIHEEDLPAGVADRLKDGTATVEDYAVVRSLVEERTGMDPGELSADVLVPVGPKDEVDHYVPARDLRYL